MEKEKEATHQVLDLIYTPDEGQECYEGTEQECYDFIQEQEEWSGAAFLYKVVPIVRKSALARDFRTDVNAHLMDIYSGIGIDRPINHDQILDFVAEDIQESADPLNWHSGDVAIAFRRWIEAQFISDC